MPKVISVHSYRGGTGKSNTVANLATSVALEGKRVGVVDTDVPSPGIHNLFNLEPEQTPRTLNHFLWGECPIEEAAYDVGAGVGLAPGNLYLVPSSVRADDIARILKDGYDVRQLNDGFRKLVRALNLDVLLIDTHPGLSKESFLTIAISHLLVLVLRPDKQDFQGTAVTVDVARQLNVKRMVLALNKVLPEVSFDALRNKVEETYGLPVAGMFPLSPDIVRLASEGVFCARFPDHPVSQEYRKVARVLLAD